MGSHLSRLLTPTSIAVVGASAKSENIGSQVIRGLIDAKYDGAVLPVHASAENILGMRAYPSVPALPIVPDLAVIAVAAPHVAAVIDECRSIGVELAIVMSAGFAETGSEGRALEAQVSAAGRSAGMRVLGPNTLGLLNVTDSIPIGFGLGRPDLTSPPSGDFAIISQSGSMGLALLNRATNANYGVSVFVATGNEMDICNTDILDLVVDRPDTAVIGMYMETVRDGRALLRAAARALEAGKPVVVSKVGKTRAGQRAVKSHTGAIAGSEEVYDAAFKTAGIISVNDIDSMFDVARFLSSRRPVMGNRVGIVTQSGGGGAWVADALSDAGLEVPRPSEPLGRRLRQIVPDFASTANPIDLTAAGTSVDAFSGVLATMTEYGEYDAFVIVRPLVDTSFESIQRLSSATTLPIIGFTHWLPQGDLQHNLGRLSIPYVTSPIRVAEALRAALDWSWTARRAEHMRGTLTSDSSTAVESALDFADPIGTLSRHGIPMIPWRVARGLEEASRAAQDLGFPVAMKLYDPMLTHKSELGALQLGLPDHEAVAKAYCELERIATKHGYERTLILQRMCHGGTEVLVGCKVDPDFGPVVAVAAGGIYAELLADSSIRLAPVSEETAMEMVMELAVGEILNGARGHMAKDLDALCSIIRRVSEFAVLHQDCLGEVDLNPVVVLDRGQGAWAVDGVLTACAPSSSAGRREPA